MLNPSNNNFLEKIIKSIEIVESDYSKIKQSFIDNSKDHYSVESGIERWTKGYNEILND